MGKQKGVIMMVNAVKAAAKDASSVKIIAQRKKPVESDSDNDELSNQQNDDASIGFLLVLAGPTAIWPGRSLPRKFRRNCVPKIL